MRCPKCGFITFDNLEKCLKCNKDLKDVTGLMHGTVFKVQAPLFLKISTEEEAKDFGEDIEIIGGSQDEKFDLQDPDLEILFDEEAEVADDSSSLRLEKDSNDLEVISSADFDAAKDDDGQVSIDLGQFRNDRADEDSGLEDIFSEGKEERLSLELPDGLTDISDLAPPQKNMAPSPLQKSTDRPQSGDDFEFDLDLDLDLGGLDKKLPGRPPVKAKKVEKLSLDEIDLPTTRPAGAPRKGESDAMNMDEELNFDLDLGGLSIHKD